MIIVPEELNLILYLILASLNLNNQMLLSSFSIGPPSFRSCYLENLSCRIDSSTSLYMTSGNLFSS